MVSMGIQEIDRHARQKIHILRRIISGSLGMKFGINKAIFHVL